MKIIDIIKAIELVEDFRVDFKRNGYSMDVSGKRFNGEEDYNGNPDTDYLRFDLVTNDVEEINEAVQFLLSLPAAATTE